MLDAALKAVAFVEGRSPADLKADEMRALALIHVLEVLGEASTGVSQETKNSYPELPWAKMAATRNRLAHGYFNIDLEVVWRISTEDLPPVIVKLRGLVENE